MRVQLQYKKQFTHAIALLNTEETGVTKFQVRTGLFELWQTGKSYASWFSYKDQGKAFTRAIVYTSIWLKTATPVSEGGTIYSEQWMPDGRRVARGDYRVDTENLRGTNLRM